ncbi:MAG: exodeoxyribonuclease VII large subunit [Thermoanaerobaculia bacterium]
MDRFPRGFIRRRAPSRDTLTEGLLPFGADEVAPAAVTVSAFVARINGALRGAVPDAWVRGEVGDWKVWSSGHAYFSLKDDAACLNAMMWADDVARLPFRVESGMELLARGRPDVYARSGKLSFVVSELQPVGLGALQLAFEQLKARLSAEGLFDLSRKRALPQLPRRIGVVTSRSGAAVRDILKVLSSRFPNAHVTIYPVAVQGAGAAAEVAHAVEAFSRTRCVDVVIVARGGGSKEDLHAFNDERVVRAVARSAVPTISAVGHEIDITLTDLAADVRAATPSQAAELVVARREELDGLLSRRSRELLDRMVIRLSGARTELMSLSGSRGLGELPSRVRSAHVASTTARRDLLAGMRNLPAVFNERLMKADHELRSWPARASLGFQQSRLEQEFRALTDRMAARLASAREKAGLSSGQLGALDPLRVLARGYAVTFRDTDPRPVTDAASVAVDDLLRIRLAHGELRARVVSTTPEPVPGLDGANDEMTKARSERPE